MADREYDLPGVGKVVLHGAIHTEENTANYSEEAGVALLPSTTRAIEESLGRPLRPKDRVVCLKDEPSGYVTGVVDRDTFKAIMKQFRKEQEEQKHIEDVDKLVVQLADHMITHVPREMGAAILLWQGEGEARHFAIGGTLDDMADFIVTLKAYIAQIEKGEVETFVKDSKTGLIHKSVKE